MPRVIFFDLVGTLIEVDQGVGCQYTRVAAEYGIRLDRTAVDAAFPEALRAVMTAPWERGTDLDSITIPATAGAAKPDPAIFLHACAHHGVQPEQALHVGDSPADDVDGARGAGCGAVLLDRAGRHPGGLPGAVRMTSLADLPAFALASRR